MYTFSFLKPVCRVTVSIYILATIYYKINDFYENVMKT